MAERNEVWEAQRQGIMQAATDLCDNIKRVRIEHRSEVSKRDVRISRAIEFLESPCSACKGCDESCATLTVVRFLRGEPSTRCTDCLELWDGPIEFDEDSMEVKQAQCPFCVNAELEAATQKEATP